QPQRFWDRRRTTGELNIQLPQHLFGRTAVVEGVWSLVKPEILVGHASRSPSNRLRFLKQRYPAPAPRQVRRCRQPGDTPADDGYIGLLQTVVLVHDLPPIVLSSLSWHGPFQATYSQQRR